jgi:ribonucleoside-diphosphate reductase alpha chain
MNAQVTVIKSDGSKRHIDLDKIHRMVERACRGLTGVSESSVEMNSGLQFYDGITTGDIQKILVKSASDLISLESPNYQFVAARLLLYGVQKQVFNTRWKDSEIYPPLGDIIQRNIKNGVYDKDILTHYTEDDIEQCNKFIRHTRDLDFTYAGLQQIVDKYLVQDRSSNTLFETPQFMYMLIAMTLFKDYGENRLSYVRGYYDAISQFKINIPTPIMAGVRTPLRQFASCVLVDSADTLDSIFSSDMAIGKYVAQRAGIGINAGRIRGIGSKIRGGEVQHTGVIPFLKKFEATVRSCTQNGVRGGSATVHFPIWHQEIEDILVLKNNKGTEDNRVRKLDYSIQLSELFYKRFLKNEDITLFSPHSVPGLYEAFGTPEFDELYEKYERATSVPKQKIGARQLFTSLLKERAETGRIYIMNIDHCNTHSSFIDKVNMSNLCQEITLPTDPISHIDGEGEIALCILSAVNVGIIKNLDELSNLCDLAVRGLEELIDYQKYPVVAAEVSTKARRSLGIGYIGLAHFLAKNKVKYDDPQAHQLVHDLSERFQYELLKASNQIASEKGPCDWFHKTKYSKGILPIDTYKKEVDTIIPNVLQCDWDVLRTRIKVHGLRHSTLTAQMPSESSSVVSNATNGVEPPRDYLSVKKSKKGTLKQVVPQYSILKNNYTLLWDMPSNDGYIKVLAVMQKFFDQAISGNWSYNPENYDKGEVPVSVMAQDMLNTYKYGWKTSYYQNTMDGKVEDVITDPNSASNDYIPPMMHSPTNSDDEEDCDACAI